MFLTPHGIPITDKGAYGGVAKLDPDTGSVLDGDGNPVVGAGEMFLKRSDAPTDPAELLAYINDALVLATAFGMSVRLSAGTWDIDTAGKIELPERSVLRGMGQWITRIVTRRSDMPGVKGISSTPTHDMHGEALGVPDQDIKPFTVSDMQIYYDGADELGPAFDYADPLADIHAAIFLGDDTMTNAYSVIQRVATGGGFRHGIHTHNCWGGEISDTWHYAYRDSAIQRTNNYNPDRGIFWLSRNFGSAYPGPTGMVRIDSAGVTGEKFSELAVLRLRGGISADRVESTYGNGLNQITIHTYLDMTGANEDFQYSSGQLVVLGDNADFISYPGSVTNGRAFLVLDSEYGRVGTPGYGFVGNRLETVQMSGCLCHVSRMLDIRAIGYEFNEVVCKGNQGNYGSQIKLSATGVRNLALDNDLSNHAGVGGDAGPVHGEPPVLVVNGAFASGTFSHQGDYRGFTAAPELPFTLPSWLQDFIGEGAITATYDGETGVVTITDEVIIPPGESHDDFTDADATNVLVHTPTEGPAWDTWGQLAEIHSNKLKWVSGAGAHSTSAFNVVAIDRGVSDAVSDAAVTPKAATVGVAPEVGVCARFDPTNQSGYFFQIAAHAGGSGQKARLYRWDGTGMTILQNVSQTLAFDSTYTLSLEADGDSMIGKIGGVTVFTQTACTMNPGATMFGVCSSQDEPTGHNNDEIDGWNCV